MGPGIKAIKSTRASQAAEKVPNARVLKGHDFTESHGLQLPRDALLEFAAARVVLRPPPEFGWPAISPGHKLNKINELLPLSDALALTNSAFSEFPSLAQFYFPRVCTQFRLVNAQ